MNIYLPDGKAVELVEGANALDCAKKIGSRLAKDAIAARVNGNLVDLNTTLHDNDRIEIVTFTTPEGKSIFWHSSSHIMAQAVQELFPLAKIA
ncbi:MAG: TGS domain-containing protein, partial [Chitinivibrionales bacterium]|nr:TGS domain-containing protein [Chitinivibrionales bacterium]